MKIATMIDYADDFQKTVQRAQEFERAGVDMILIAEAYGFDAVSMLGYLASVTERVELVSAILNTFSRTPACLAQTAAGLDALSKGRFTLGLGASGPQVIEGFHGLPYELTLTRTREIMDICRMIWRRERVQYDGKAFQLPVPAGKGTGQGKPLKMINHPLRDSIPIWLATLTPKSVEMTAEGANGWIPFLFAPELSDRVWGEALKKGLSKRDPALGTLNTVAGGVLAIGANQEGHREKVRPMAALYIGGMGSRKKNFYNDVCKAYGFEAEAKEIQDLYLDGKKVEAMAAVPAELVEKCTLCGDEGYIKDRLAAHKAAGVQVLNVAPVGDDPVGQLAKLRELVNA